MKIGDTEMEETEQLANNQLRLCILDRHNITEYEVRKQTLT